MKGRWKWRRARGTPRIANRLLRRVREFCRGDAAPFRRISPLRRWMLSVDAEGCYMDHRLLA